MALCFFIPQCAVDNLCRGRSDCHCLLRYICSTLNRLLLISYSMWAAVGLTLPAVAQSQPSGGHFSCIQAQEIKLPLSSNDFSDSQVLRNDVTVNALYYLYQDKYTFWYKITSSVTDTLHFSALPSVSTDRYEALVFRYDGPDFCDYFVSGKAAAETIERVAVPGQDGRLLYRNVLPMQPGDVAYVCVLSLNDEDCGHRLYLRTAGQDLSINALHRPCYEFQVIDEVPDFSAAFAHSPDVSLDLAEGMGSKEAKRSFKTAMLKTCTLLFSDTEGQWMVNMPQVEFIANSFTLKPLSEKSLFEILEFLRENADATIELRAHVARKEDYIQYVADNSGPVESEDFLGNSAELTQRRAEEIMAYLTERGIPAKRIVARGYDNGVPDATAGNVPRERVDLIIAKK